MPQRLQKSTFLTMSALKTKSHCQALSRPKSLADNADCMNAVKIMAPGYEVEKMVTRTAISWGVYHSQRTEMIPWGLNTVSGASVRHCAVEDSLLSDKRSGTGMYRVRRSLCNWVEEETGPSEMEPMPAQFPEATHQRRRGRSGKRRCPSRSSWQPSGRRRDPRRSRKPGARREPECDRRRGQAGTE